MKKGISLLLSVLMILSVFSCLGLTASAADIADKVLGVDKPVNTGENLITYNIYLKNDIKLNGAIVKVEFDNKVMEFVSGGEYQVKNADGDMVQNVPGIYVSGKYNDLPNAVSIAYVSANAYNVGSKPKPFMTVTFKYIGTDYKKTNVKFSCIEFNSPDANTNIAKDEANPQLIADVSTTTLNKLQYDRVYSVDNGIKISWKATKGATGYHVFKLNVEADKYEVIKDTTELSYIDTNVKSGEVVSYIVRAYNNKVGDKVDYDYYNKSVKTVFIKSPDSVSAAVRAGYVNVSWNEAKGAEGYAVYRREIAAGGITGDWVKLAVVPVSVRSYKDTRTLESNKKYEYSVASIAAGVECGKIDFAEVKYFAPPTVKSYSVYGGVNVTWNRIEGATGYDVYRRYQGAKNWTLIKTVTSGTTTSYLDADAKAGSAPIEYTVRAFDGKDVSWFVGAKVTYYAAPSITGFSIKSNGINVKWNAVSGATYYRLYRMLPGESWKYVGKTKSTNLTDTKVAEGAKVTYTVRAEYNGKLSNFKQDGWNVIYLKKPVVKSVANGYNMMKVTWYPVDGAEGYRVYRKENGSSWKYIAKLSGTGTYYEDTKVKNGANYVYTIRAYSGSLLSNFNGGKGATYFAAPSLKTANTASGVRLSWSKATGAEGYRIYRLLSPGKWKYIGKTTKTYFDDKNVTAGEEYTYTIRSYKGKALSWFNETGWSIVRLTNPAVPSVKNAVGGINVSWAASAGAENYRVYRKENGSSWKYLGKVEGETYFDKNVKSGATYTYTIRSEAAGKLSDYNRTGKSLIYVAAPTFKLSNTDNGIKISWNRVSGGDYYRIYRKEAGTNWKYITKSTSTSYEDKTAKPGVEYTYTVRAEDRKVLSNFAPEGLSIVRLTEPVLAKTEDLGEAIEVKWEATPGAVNYRIYRKVNGSSWKYIADSDTTYFVDTDVVKGSNYVYTVRAENDGKLSTFDDAGLAIAKA